MMYPRRARYTLALVLLLVLGTVTPSAAVGGSWTASHDRSGWWSRTWADSDFSADGSRVYVATENLNAYDSSNGSLAWSADCLPCRPNHYAGPSHVLAAPEGSIVYVAGSYSDELRVHSYDGATGTEGWSDALGVPGDVPEGDYQLNWATDLEMSPDATTLFVSGLSLHLDDYPMALTAVSVVAYDAVTGEQKWTIFREGGGAPSMLAGPDALFVSGFGSSLLALAPVDGQVLWKTSDVGAGDLVLSPDGGSLYMNGDAALAAIDTATGTPRWSAEHDPSQVDERCQSELGWGGFPGCYGWSDEFQTLKESLRGETVLTNHDGSVVVAARRPALNVDLTGLAEATASISELTGYRAIDGTELWAHSGVSNRGAVIGILPNADDLITVAYSDYSIERIHSLTGAPTWGDRWINGSRGGVGYIYGSPDDRALAVSGSGERVAITGLAETVWFDEPLWVTVGFCIDDAGSLERDPCAIDGL